MLKQIDESGRITWVTHVKDLLFRYGFGIVWITENVGDNNEFIYVFKQRLIDCALQDWHTEITQSRKAIHYKHFKTLLNSCIRRKYLRNKLKKGLTLWEHV